MRAQKDTVSPAEMMGTHYKLLITQEISDLKPTRA